ncbi:MAG: hypothetical protein CL468_05730 [Acidimicrobiaceae bacterium]|nr:hypothetical protein [Acidimicrobiaceae bacterium]
MTAVLGPERLPRAATDRQISGPSTRAAIRPAVGILGALAVVGFFATLLSLAAFHSIVVSGQFEFDRLQGRLEDGHERAQVLRAEVARLESPSRILEVANGRLGMVSPPARVYLPSVPLNDGPTNLKAPEGDPFSGSTR